MSRSVLLVAAALSHSWPRFLARAATDAEAKSPRPPPPRQPPTKVRATSRRWPPQARSRQPITPPKPEEIDAAIDRGVKFLLADQRPDGSWGSAERTKGLNIYAPPPGAHDAFHTAVTSLVVMALIEAEPQLPDSETADVTKAIDRGAEWLDKHLGELRRATPDALYNVWGHAYSIQALVHCTTAPPAMPSARPS